MSKFCILRLGLLGIMIDLSQGEEARNGKKLASAPIPAHRAARRSVPLVRLRACLLSTAMEGVRDDLIALMPRTARTVDSGAERRGVDSFLQVRARSPLSNRPVHGRWLSWLPKTQIPRKPRRLRPRSKQSILLPSQKQRQPKQAILLPSRDQPKRMNRTRFFQVLRRLLHSARIRLAWRLPLPLKRTCPTLLQAQCQQHAP